MIRNTFDIVVARNVTWNLPHPDQAYKPNGYEFIRSGGYDSKLRCGTCCKIITIYLQSVHQCA
ncbi:MAG: hypothetical protein ACLUPK_03095 [Veillonella sp.]